MRRWTLIALIALMVLLAMVTFYQIRLADRRSRLPEPSATAPSAP